MKTERRPLWRGVMRILVLGMAGKMVLVAAAYALAMTALHGTPL
jgi:hypothetical protein